jgi:3-hydroxyacyl-[acyl-carrier-protein] dehydratase
MELGIKEIQGIIPHRYPFLMLDRVIEVVPNERLVALKNVSVNEHYFVGHFPEDKIMPGVLIIETMAQAACVFFYYSRDKIGKKLMYYLGRTTVKFNEQVKPGDQLIIEISSVQLMKNTGFVRAKAFVDSRNVAEGEIVFSTKEMV